jgi:hypothetical protein
MLKRGNCNMCIRKARIFKGNETANSPFPQCETVFGLALASPWPRVRLAIATGADGSYRSSRSLDARVGFIVRRSLDVAKTNVVGQTAATI